MEYLNLFVKSIFIDNMIFALFLGMCSYLAVSKTVKTAVGLGAAVTFVLLVTLPVNYLLDKYVPALYGSLGIFLPLIAVNCAILGGSLFMQQKEFENVGFAAVYALGSGLGWLFAIACIAAIREKLAYSNIPAPLKGLGITFIATGLMAIAFLSFSGIQL